MANISKLKLIQAKRRGIQSRLADARALVASLETQDSNLAIAEKVLIEIDADDIQLEFEVTEPTRESAPAANENLATGKPEGIPTMPEMIFEALRDAKERGIKGLEPKDMAAYIAGKWWPDVKINNVGPIAWRLYKSDKLNKRQSKYRLPDDQTVAA
jgi:hypothetical protein